MDSQEKNVDKVSGRRGHVRSGKSRSRRMTRWQRIGTDNDQAKKFYDALCPYWQNDKIEIFGGMVLCCLPGQRRQCRLPGQPALLRIIVGFLDMGTG